MFSAAAHEIIEVFCRQDDNPGYVGYSYTDLLRIIEEKKVNISLFEERLELYRIKYGKAILKRIKDDIDYEMENPGSTRYDLNEIRADMGEAEASGFDTSELKPDFGIVEIQYEILIIEKRAEGFLSSCDDIFSSLAEDIRRRMGEVRQLGLDEKQEGKLRSLEAALKKKEAERKESVKRQINKKA